jgi:hypothetical protein
MFVAGKHHVVFGFAVRQLGQVGCKVMSCRVWLCGTCAFLIRLLGSIMSSLAVWYWSSVRQVSCPGHILFGNTVI